MSSAIPSVRDSAPTPGEAFVVPAEFQNQWFWHFDSEDETDLEPLLKSSAGRIWASLAARNATTCTLADWAVPYLKELNMVAAAVMFNLACVRLSSEQRVMYNGYLTLQLEMIRKGEIDVCAGSTGVDTPAWGVIQYNTTPRQAVNLILNAERRGLD